MPLNTVSPSFILLFLVWPCFKFFHSNSPISRADLHGTRSCRAIAPGTLQATFMHVVCSVLWLAGFESHHMPNTPTQQQLAERREAILVVNRFDGDSMAVATSSTPVMIARRDHEYQTSIAFLLSFPHKASNDAAANNLRRRRTRARRASVDRVTVGNVLPRVSRPRRPVRYGRTERRATITFRARATTIVKEPNPNAATAAAAHHISPVNGNTSRAFPLIE